MAGFFDDMASFMSTASGDVSSISGSVAGAAGSIAGTKDYIQSWFGGGQKTLDPASTTKSPAAFSFAGVMNNPILLILLIALFVFLAFGKKIFK